MLLYHIVFPVKFRQSVLTPEIESSLVQICQEISERFEIHFVEIGSDINHIHYLVQSIPNLSVSDIVRTTKSITAKQLFKRHPELKKELWGGNIWTSGYYANTVGQYGNEVAIKKYIEKQSAHYQQIMSNQLTLFT